MANQQPVSLESESIRNLFPHQTTLFEMNTWFANAVPPNPIFQAMPTGAAYDFDNTRQYNVVSQSQNPFRRPLVDGHRETAEREQISYIIHHRDVAAFDQGQNLRSVSPNTAQNAMLNGAPVATHWIYQRGGAADLSKPWQSRISAFLNKKDTDAQGGMVDIAKAVWNRLNPQAASIWHAHAGVPGRLVRIWLYYLRESADCTPGMVKWLLGGRLRPHFDHSALYAARRTGQAPSTNFVFHLIRWLEFSCAHMLTEVFMNYYRVHNSGPSRNMLRETFRLIARRYPHRQFLENNIDLFPYK